MIRIIWAYTCRMLSLIKAELDSLRPCIVSILQAQNRHFSGIVPRSLLQEACS